MNWHDIPSEKLDLMEARQAVKELRETVAKMREREIESVKPPLGIKPAWLFYETRIKDLADAISRYADGTHDMKSIRKWSMEITLLTSVMENNKQILK